MSLNTAHEGYAYQDLLTIYFILKELLKGNKNTIFSIDKKHINNDRFDDLVTTKVSYTPTAKLKEMSLQDDGLKKCLTVKEKAPTVTIVK